METPCSKWSYLFGNSRKLEYQITWNDFKRKDYKALYKLRNN